MSEKSQINWAMSQPKLFYRKTENWPRILFHKSAGREIKIYPPPFYLFTNSYAPFSLSILLPLIRNHITEFFKIFGPGFWIFVCNVSISCLATRKAFPINFVHKEAFRARRLSVQTTEYNVQCVFVVAFIYLTNFNRYLSRNTLNYRLVLTLQFHYSVLGKSECRRCIFRHWFHRET